MKKNLSIAALFFMLTLSAVAQEVYRSENNAFMISFPKGWEISKGSGLVDFIAGYDENVSLNIVVRQNPAFEGLTIEQAVDDKFINSIVEQYKSQFENFAMIENGIGTVNTYSAFYIKYNADISNKGGRLTARQYYVLNNSKLYVISTGSPEADYQFNEIMFNEIVNSFTLIQ